MPGMLLELWFKNTISSPDRIHQQHRMRLPTTTKSLMHMCYSDLIREESSLRKFQTDYEHILRIVRLVCV